MARVETIVVGGGVGNTAPFTTGQIPFIVAAVPPAISDSIMRQVNVAGVLAIINGTTDPSSTATEQFRTAGGLISTGPGTDSVRLGRANVVSGTDSIGIGRANTDSGTTTAMIALGTANTQTAATNTMIGRSNTLGGNNGLVLGDSNTIGAAANNCVVIGNSVVIGAAVSNVICIFAPGNIAGNFVPAAGMTYLGHGSNGFVVVGTGDNNTGSRQCRIRGCDLSGAGNNTVGNDLLLSAGLGTGNATGSSVILQSPEPGVSGGALQTRTTRLILNNLGATFDKRVQQPLVTLTYQAAIVIDASLGDWFVCTITNATAFAIGAPSNTPVGTSQKILLTFRNASGGAHGAGTFNAVFKTAAAGFPAIGNGQSRSFEFRWDGTNWVETFRSAADIAN